jgi:hypothetical protein
MPSASYGVSNMVIYIVCCMYQVCLKCIKCFYNTPLKYTIFLFMCKYNTFVLKKNIMVVLYIIKIKKYTMDKIEYIPPFDQFKINEATLAPIHQTQLMKTITKAFDVNDLKYYLKGMMIDLDITTRKRLNAFLEEEKYRTVITKLITLNETDPVAILKLKNIYKVIVQSERTGNNLTPPPETEETTEMPA